MNRKEVSEIKKVVKPENPYCTLNKLFITMVNAEGVEVFTKNPSVLTLSDRETDMYYKIFKNMLSTNVGKNFIQYDFEKEAFNPGRAQDTLYSVLSGGFNNEEQVNAFRNRIVENLIYTGPYAIITGYFTYTVRHRNKADEVDGFSDEDFNFMLTAICPANIVDSGFSYNNQSGEFSTESDPKLYISSKPTDGFMFPAFDNRSSDISSIMYFAKKPGDLNTSMVLDVLMTNFEISPVAETELFHSVIKGTFGEKLDYQLVLLINDALIEYIQNFTSETKPIKLGKLELSNIIENVATEEELERFKSLYDAVCDNIRFDVVNLISKKMKLQTSEYSLSFNCIYGSKVTAKVVDSMRAIQLTTEDNLLDVNGVVVSMK